MAMSKVIKKLLKAEDILEALSPITTMLRLLGFPYCIEKKKDSEGYVFKVTVSFMINFIFGGIIFIWCLYQFHVNESAAIVDTAIMDAFFRYGDRFIVYLNSIVVGFLYWSSFIDINGYPKVAFILSDIEKLWKVLGIRKEYSQIKLKLIFAAIIQSCVPCGQMIFSIGMMMSWMNKPSYYEFLPMFIPGYTYTVVLASYCIFIIQGSTVNCWIISTELECIHEKRFLAKAEAEYLFLDDDSTKLRQNALLQELESSSRDEVVSERLVHYWKIYDRVCDYTDSVNETFSFKVTLIFGMSFGSMIFNLFVSLSAVQWMAKGGEKTLFFLTYALGQSTIHFTNMLLTILILQACQKSVSRNSSANESILLNLLE